MRIARSTSCCQFAIKARSSLFLLNEQKRFKSSSASSSASSSSSSSHITSPNQNPYATSSLPRTQLDYSKIVSDPRKTRLNHVQRRVQLPLGEGQVDRIVALRERQVELQEQINSIKAQQKKVGALIAQVSGSRRSTEATSGSSNTAPQGGEGGSGIDTKENLQKQAQYLKSEVLKYGTKSTDVDTELLDLTLALPNYSDPISPIGPESNAITLTHFGPEPIKADPKRDHLALCNLWSLIDNEASSHTSGSSWPFLIGLLALLEQALINHALDITIKNGFKPVITPDVVRSDVSWRCGFQPRDPFTGAATQTYLLQGEEGSPEMCLAGTGEIPLAGLFAGKILSNLDVDGFTSGGGEKEGAGGTPKKVVGVGRAFRAEAGARGADTRGLYRIHQFTKVEMFVVSSEDGSEKCFEEMGKIQREIVEPLGIPVRVLEMPTEELGASASRKWDMEAWLPGRGKWGEISSLSNCTDYQSRRLHIRYRPHTPSSTDNPIDRREGPKTAFAHTLNGTAAAIPRLLIALLENGVRFGDGGKIPVGLELPSCLKRFWVGGDEFGEVGKGKMQGKIYWN